MDNTELLSSNNFIEVQDWLVELGRQVNDDDFNVESSDPVTLGIRISAAETYVKTYAGTSNFVNDLRDKMLRGLTLTLRQDRAALNVMQDDLKKERMKIARKDGMAPAAPTIKADSNSNKSEKVVVEGPVIEKREESILDVSGLPDGRYACPRKNETGTRTTIFLAVKTVKKPYWRSKRYRWSKFNPGRELVPAGTVEVREWKTDSKRLCGEQVTGHGYAGEYIDELSRILGNPQMFAEMFAISIGSCSICGKTLTDDISKLLLIGPECEKRYGKNYWADFKRNMNPASTAVA